MKSCVFPNRAPYFGQIPGPKYTFTLLYTLTLAVRERVTTINNSLIFSLASD